MALSLVLVASGTRLAHAQDGSAADDAPPRLQLLTNFDFHFAMARLSGDDERFVWDADYGGDIDLLDYGRGRVNFLANYEAILGEQLRRFDPNQGNYTLQVSSSVRFDDLEVAGVFHHVSRHLSDRPKAFAIDWNMVGILVERPFAFGATTVEAHGRAMWTIKRSFVDYRAEYGAEARVRHPVHPRLAVIAAGGLTLVPVEGFVSGPGFQTALTGRGLQTGALIEGGLRIEGTGAAGEFFVGFERRIDADPFAGVPRNWALVGFRLVSR